MNLPTIFTALGVLLLLFSIIYFWLSRLDRKLKQLYSEYQKALALRDEKLAKEAGKKYYSSILFGLTDNDETAIEKEIQQASLYAVEESY